MRLYFDTANLIEETLIEICCDEDNKVSILLKKDENNSLFIDIPNGVKKMKIKLCNANEGTASLKAQTVSNTEIDVSNVWKQIETNKAKSNTRHGYASGSGRKRIKLSEYAGVEDVLSYQQAYETVLTNISGNTSEIYFRFAVLNVLDGTILKIVALKEKSGVCMFEENIDQIFHRIPSKEDVKAKYLKKRNIFLVKLVLAILCLLCIELVAIPYFSDFEIEKNIKIAFFVVCAIYVVWISLTFFSEKEGYRILCENENICLNHMDDSIVFSWEKNETEEDKKDYCAGRESEEN